MSGDSALGKSGQVSLSSDDTTVDTALAESDSEETVFTPIRTPRVGNNPEVGTVFVTPTDDLDGMATESFTALMSIDTTSVRHEILVDSETSFNRAVLLDVGLDGGGVRELDDGSLNSVVVLNSRTISALSEVLALDGLSTVVRSIGEAAVSDETIADEEPPGEQGNTTVASVVQDVVAREEVLGREDNIDATVGGNAESVGEDFRSSESPAGSAVALISDGVDASGPLFRGVEISGDILITFVVEDSQVLVFGEVNELSTQELLLDLFVGHALELLGDSSSPGASETVQVVNERLGDDLLFTNDDGVHSSTDPVAQISEVLVIKSSNSALDFSDDFDVVDQETLSNVVEESFRVSEGLGEFDEHLDISSGGSANLSSVGNNLSGFTEEGNTFLDLSGVLGLDISDTLGDILDNNIDISDAGLDVIKDSFAGDTDKETSDEVEDISLGVLDGLLSDDDGVHSLTDPVAQVGVVLVFVSLNSAGDFMDDFDVVDQEALSNVVEESFRGSEGLGEVDELLDISSGGLARLGSVGDNLSSLTEEDDTLLNLSRILGLDVFDSSVDISGEGINISNAGLDVVEDGGGTDTGEETLDEVDDISLGVLGVEGLLSDEDGVHGSSDPVTEVGEISSLVSLDSTVDFLEDINSVDDEGLANIVQERSGVLEGLDHLEEGGNISTSNLALLDGSGDDFDGLTDEGNTFFNLGSDLSLDIFNTSDDVGDDSLVILDASLDVVEDGGGADAVKETLDEVQDVGLVVRGGLISGEIVGVLEVFVDSESQIVVTLGKRASNEEEKG